MSNESKLTQNTQATAEFNDAAVEAASKEIAANSTAVRNHVTKFSSLFIKDSQGQTGVRAAFTGAGIEIRKEFKRLHETIKDRRDVPFAAFTIACYPAIAAGAIFFNFLWGSDAGFKKHYQELCNTASVAVRHTPKTTP